MSLLNSTPPGTKKDTVLTLLDRCSELEAPVTPLEVHLSIKQLKSGKSCGLDYLQSEHFKNACDKLSVLLCLCFNSMILHGYVTEGFSDTILIPIIKDKKGNITDPDNYRPIAISSVTSKIFENILLKRLQSYICTSDNQFGFKPKHSTDMCVFVLKQIIDYYFSMSSPLYICYLAASKAFDRLNYWLLFDKLIERSTPRILVRFLMKVLLTRIYCSMG